MMPTMDLETPCERCIGRITPRWWCGSRGRLRLLTRDGLGRLMADAWDDDYVDLKHAGISDALGYEPPGTMVVMAGDRTVTEAGEVFTRLTASRVYAIVVTDSGDDQSQPSGIVTPWDLCSP